MADRGGGRARRHRRCRTRSPGRSSCPPPTGCSSSAGRPTGRPRSRRSGRRPSTESGKLGVWVRQADLYLEVMDHSAATVGDYLWVWGGTSIGGPTKTVQRGEFGTGQDLTRLERFGVAGGGTDLPGTADERQRASRSSGAHLQRRRQRRDRAPDRDVLGHPERRRQHPRVEAPRPERPARVERRDRGRGIDRPRARTRS